MTTWQIMAGDCVAGLQSMPAASVQCCITSPPYWGLRDYGHDGQIGLEATPDAYVAQIVAVFREVRRVLKDDGTLWLNLGDSYAAQRGGTDMPAETLAGGVSGQGDEIAKRGRGVGYRPHRNASSLGLKHKDLVGIPWRVAFALQADGWYLRQDIIWHKPNPMPESVTDRCTKAHEYVFLLTKSAKYYYDAEAVKEAFADERMGNPGGGGHYAREAFAHVSPHAQSGLQKGEWNTDGGKTGRNKRSVWTVSTSPYRGAHFAVMPEALVEPCLLAGSRPGDLVLDPFAGSGTVGAVAIRHGRSFLGCELNPDYIALARQRIGTVAPMFSREQVQEATP